MLLAINQARNHDGVVDFDKNERNVSKRNLEKNYYCHGVFTSSLHLYVLPSSSD